MIDSFKGENRFLSNFGEGGLWYGGHHYLNRESAYQASKLPPNCEASRILYESTSGVEAKALSKKLKHLTRPDWKQYSLVTMSEIVHAFFTQNKQDRMKLLATGDEDLVEGNNWHDTFYGVCNCGGNFPVCHGGGMNWLGRILMAERAYWKVLHR